MTTKQSTTPTAYANQSATNALRDADALVQQAEKSTTAALAAIRLLLKEPDSGWNRINILQLVETIHEKVFDAMNSINFMAEEHGANWVDERARAESKAMWAAARGEVQS